MTRIGDDIAATVAALDELHRPARERRARDFGALQAIVANLSTPWDPDLEDAIVDLRPGAPQAARRGSQPDPSEERPGDVPPTKDFHPWGASMRERFIREAKSRGSW
jgi:hypothetical protein